MGGAGLIQRLKARLRLWYDLRQIPPFYDRQFVTLFCRHADKTMVPWQGLYAAYQAAKYVATQQVPGDLVECGVWRGGCSLIMAEALAAHGDTSREVYLYDTFSGMSQPSELDVKSDGLKAQDKYDSRQRGDHIDWCYSPLEEVQSYVEASSYPSAKYRLVKGKVEDTIPGVAPERIALLRLDTDWYESTRHNLEHLFPRLVPGGVLILDDYGHWKGARQATDEYFAANQVRIFLLPASGQGCVAGVKQA